MIHKDLSSLPGPPVLRREFLHLLRLRGAAPQRGGRDAGRARTAPDPRPGSVTEGNVEGTEESWGVFSVVSAGEWWFV